MRLLDFGAFGGQVRSASERQRDADKLLEDLKLSTAVRSATRKAYPQAFSAPAPERVKPPPPPPLVVPHLTTAIMDVSREDYFRDPCEQPSLSQSMAQILTAKSPQHAWQAHPRFGGKPRIPTIALENGTLIHALLLGEEDTITVIEAKNFKTKAARELRDEARENGTTPILADDFEVALERAKVLAQRLAEIEDSKGRPAPIVLDGKSEQTIFWVETADDGTPVQCRARLDHVKPFQVLDLKSIRSAHPDIVQRHVDQYGYAIQRAAYVSAKEKVEPGSEGRNDFLFVFLELESCVVLPARLSGSFRALGERRWRRAVNLWAECLKTDRWPGYTKEVLTITAPTWAMSKEVEKNMAAGGDGNLDDVFGVSDAAEE